VAHNASAAYGDLVNLYVRACRILSPKQMTYAQTATHPTSAQTCAWSFGTLQGVEVLMSQTGMALGIRAQSCVPRNRIVDCRKRTTSDAVL
jgi:hypothetical protein